MRASLITRLCKFVRTVEDTAGHYASENYSGESIHAGALDDFRDLHTDACELIDQINAENKKGGSEDE